MGTRRIVAAASLVLFGLLTACTEDVSEEVSSTESESALTGCGQKGVTAAVTCDFTYLQKCAFPATCKPVAGLGKGRKVTVLQECATNGYYRVKELNNDKLGWVKGTCLAKSAAAPKKPAAPAAKDAGAADAAKTPPAPEPEAAPEPTPAPPASTPAQNFPPSEASSTELKDEEESEEEETEEPAPKRPMMETADGCSVTHAPAPSSAPTWLLWVGLGAVVPFVARRRRR